MNELSPDIEKYIEHEVKLRVLNSKNEDIYKKFDSIDKRFDKFESRFEARFLMIVGLLITSIVLPVVLHSLKLV